MPKRFRNDLLTRLPKRLNLWGRGDGYSDAHESVLKTHFDGRVRFDGAAPVLPHGLLVLAFTNRSGSNMLADYLRQTRRVSGLEEFLNRSTVTTQATEQGIDNFPDYIAYLTRTMTRKGLTFGVKASAEQLRFLKRWRITEMFTSVTVVHVHRDDLLAQAVSLWIAKQTGQWTSLQQRQNDTVSFEPEKIMLLTKSITAEDGLIRQFCAHEGLNYVSLSYEEIIANVDAAVARVGTAAGFDTSKATLNAPKIGKQADARNDQILAQLRQHIAQFPNRYDR